MDNFIDVLNKIKENLCLVKGYATLLEKDIKCLPLLVKSLDDSILFLKSCSNFEFYFEIINLSKLLNNLVSKYNIILENKIPDNIYIYGDYSKLRKAFENIIENSIEATDSKKLIIRIKMFLYCGKVIVIIKDNGIGIKRGNIKKIGTPFYTTKNKAGLGCFISKLIINKHNGVIWYKSKYKKGTVVYIKLDQLF